MDTRHTQRIYDNNCQDLALNLYKIFKTIDGLCMQDRWIDMSMDSQFILVLGVSYKGGFLCAAAFTSL